MTLAKLEAAKATQKAVSPPVLDQGILRPLDHRDAIRGGNPLARLGGLALEFVTKVVAAPLSLFLVVDDEERCRLAAVKVEPILTADPFLLEEDFLRRICCAHPILGIQGGFGQTRVMDLAKLHENKEFTESHFVTEFLEPNGFGPVLVLMMKEPGSGQTCIVVLVRSAEEQDFNDREKGFLRQMAPLLTQSWSCASEVSPTRPVLSAGGLDCLTRREQEIARLAATGAHNVEIADALHIAAGTVKCHIRSIYAKLGVDSRVHLSMLLAER